MMNQLEQIRKERKVLEVARPDSEIKTLFKNDGYVYNISTDPVENLPSVYMNEVYRKM